MRISDWSSDVCSSDLAAIDRIVGQAAIRRTRAVTSAVEPVDQIDHPFEIERVKALDHRRIVRTADALELVGQADQLEDIVGNVRRRSRAAPGRSEEHTSELQSLMRISYAVFCLIKKK